MTATATYGIDTASPTRIAIAADAPFRIINTSITVQVWVSTNPGMKVGEGTPVNPGTSITWTNPVDLWAIATAASSLIITNDVNDWQPDPAAIAAAVVNSGIIVIDSPVLLLDAVRTDQTVDISRYQSIAVQMYRSSGANAALYERVQLGFDYAGSLNSFPMLSREFEFIPGVSINDPVLYGAVLPCVGGVLKLKFAVGNIVQVSVVGSHRPEEFQQQISTIIPGSFIAEPSLELGALYPAPVALASGGTLNLSVPPWIGDVSVNIVLQLTSGTIPAVVNPLVAAAKRWQRYAPVGIVEYDQWGVKIADAVTGTVHVSQHILSMAGAMEQISLVSQHNGNMNLWCTVVPSRKGI